MYFPFYFLPSLLTFTLPKTDQICIWLILNFPDNCDIHTVINNELPTIEQYEILSNYDLMIISDKMLRVALRAVPRLSAIRTASRTQQTVMSVANLRLTQQVWQFTFVFPHIFIRIWSRGHINFIDFSFSHYING